MGNKQEMEKTTMVVSKEIDDACHNLSEEIGEYHRSMMLLNPGNFSQLQLDSSKLCMREFVRYGLTKITDDAFLSGLNSGKHEAKQSTAHCRHEVHPEGESSGYEKLYARGYNEGFNKAAVAFAKPSKEAEKRGFESGKAWGLTEGTYAGYKDGYKKGFDDATKAAPRESRTAKPSYGYLADEDAGTFTNKRDSLNWNRFPIFGAGKGVSFHLLPNGEPRVSINVGGIEADVTPSGRAEHMKASAKADILAASRVIENLVNLGAIRYPDVPMMIGGEQLFATYSNGEYIAIAVHRIYGNLICAGSRVLGRVWFSELGKVVIDITEDAMFEGFIVFPGLHEFAKWRQSVMAGKSLGLPKFKNELVSFGFPGSGWMAEADHSHNNFVLRYFGDEKARLSADLKFSWPDTGLPPGILDDAKLAIRTQFYGRIAQ